MDQRVAIGQRIARERRRRGLSQVVVANLVGRSESWLSQVERGRRSIDSHSVLVALAGVLKVDVEQLTSKEVPDSGMGKYEPATAIRDALLRYDSLTAGTDPRRSAGSPPRLRWISNELRRINRLYHETRYAEAGRSLPGLLLVVDEAVLTPQSADRRTLYSLKALSYQTASTVLNRVGETELAWMTADRSLAAAQAAERPLLTAVSAYRLGYALIRQKRAEQAESLAIRMMDVLEGSRSRRTRPVISMLGALSLMASRAAIGRFDRAATDAHLSRARSMAEELGADGNDFWTAFGPTNVAIHEVSSAVYFGDASHAVTRASSLSLDNLGPTLTGRRTQVRLDLARAYALQRKDAAAVNTLLEAERLSPELVRHDGRTHDLLTELVRREHRASTPELRGLAHRAGVV